MKKVVLLVFLVGVLITSCKIKEPPLTRLDLLTDKEWFVKENSAGEVLECDKDDPFNFKDDGTFVVLFEAGITCEPNGEIERFVAFWEFYGDDEFVWLVEGELDTLTILELNKNVLKLESDGEVFTLKH